MHPENRGISTFWFQCLKEAWGNCMRHCGGTMASCSERSLAARRGSVAAVVFGEGLGRESVFGLARSARWCGACGEALSQSAVHLA